MPLITFPSNLLDIIISFLDNKTNVSLIRACKYIRNHGEKFGYISYIKVDYTVNMMDFLHQYCKHSRCVTTIQIKGINDPHIWLPKFVQNIDFEHCSISQYLNPGKQAHITKKLKIMDYHSYKNKQTLLVNWDCFRNLEELELYVYDVDLTGIEKLKKLTKIKINTMKTQKT